MKDRLYIVVSRQGYVATYKTDGFTLKAGHKAFSLDIEVPDEAFAKPPMPKVSMKIPTEALIHHFEAEVQGTNGEEKL